MKTGTSFLSFLNSESHQVDHSKALVVCLDWYVSQEMQSVS